MALTKFLCFDLRVGITAMGFFFLVSACSAAIKHFIYSLDDSDPEEATQQTFYFGADIISIIVFGCLVHGAYKERRGFLLPFLITLGLFFIFFTIVILYLIVVAIFPHFYLSILLIVLILICVEASFVYFWYAVLTLYQMLDPHNPNYVPQQIPSTVVYVEDEKPPMYYANNVADV